MFCDKSLMAVQFKRDYHLYFFQNAQKLMELNNALRRKEQDLVNKEGQ